jgi:predicted nucleic acid-binding protein
VWYVESSALVSSIVEQDTAAKRTMTQARTLVTSLLTLTEAHRALVQGRNRGRFEPVRVRAFSRAFDSFAKRCHVIPVGDDILARARRPFLVEPVRTLDAIHLATIELLGADPGMIGVLTRDARIRANAIAAGYEVA